MARPEPGGPPWGPGIQDNRRTTQYSTEQHSSNSTNSNSKNNNKNNKNNNKMKLTQTPSIKRKSGMTLLELTVVILVLLSLIAILFIGARAWKRGSDRAGCLMNIRNMQQAMRGDQNMRNSAPGGTGLVAENIIGTAGYIANAPLCPTDKVTAYTIAAPGNYPALGVIYAACAQATEAANHNPTGATIADW